MIRRPPRSTRTDTPFPDPTLVRSRRNPALPQPFISARPTRRSALFGLMRSRRLRHGGGMRFTLPSAMPTAAFVLLASCVGAPQQRAPAPAPAPRPTPAARPAPPPPPPADWQEIGRAHV